MNNFQTNPTTTTSRPCQSPTLVPTTPRPRPAPGAADPLRGARHPTTQDTGPPSAPVRARWRAPAPARANRRHARGGVRSRAPTRSETDSRAESDDDARWGPPGDLPAARAVPPHHPPLLRRVAAAAELPRGGRAGGGRRRGRLQRSVSASQASTHTPNVAGGTPGAQPPLQYHFVHHYYHYHHHHHYFPAGRAAWDYATPAVRGMPVLGEERGDWETPVARFPAARELAGRRAHGRRRRRLVSWLPWRGRRGTAADDDDGFDFSYEELIELDARNVSRGFTEEELARLEHFPWPDGEAADCHICLEPFEAGAEVVKLKCGHAYHHACIATWLRMKRTCPICRCEL